MTRREKVILAATGLLAVVALGSLLVGKDPAKTAAVPPAAAQQTAQARDNALAMVRQATPGAVEAALMAAIDKPWATKAFYEKSLETRSAAKPTAMPRFTGYVELGSGRLAVIDGYEYQAGDTLEGGGYTVRTVSPDRVTLESLANGQPLELPYDGLESQSR
ncbi:hypothetical protein [Solidesulfovibrio sp.]